MSGKGCEKRGRLACLQQGFLATAGGLETEPESSG